MRGFLFLVLSKTSIFVNWITTTDPDVGFDDIYLNQDRVEMFRRVAPGSDRIFMADINGSQKFIGYKFNKVDTHDGFGYTPTNNYISDYEVFMFYFSPLIPEAYASSAYKQTFQRNKEKVVVPAGMSISTEDGEPKPITPLNSYVSYKFTDMFEGRFMPAQDNPVQTGEMVPTRLLITPPKLKITRVLLKVKFNLILA